MTTAEIDLSARPHGFLTLHGQAYRHGGEWVFRSKPPVPCACDKSHLPDPAISSRCITDPERIGLMKLAHEGVAEVWTIRVEATTAEQAAKLAFATAQSLEWGSR